MKEEKNHKQCYETEAGTPSLTVELVDEQRMIPYSSFETAQLNSKRDIVILFSRWILEIKGEYLNELWEQLQMQDVRIVRLSKGSTAYECSIIHLKLTVRGGD